MQLSPDQPQNRLGLLTVSHLVLITFRKAENCFDSLEQTPLNLIQREN